MKELNYSFQNRVFFDIFLFWNMVIWNFETITISEFIFFNWRGAESSRFENFISKISVLFS